MTVDKAVFATAGVVVLIGLLLGYYVNTYWFLLTAFTGVNMIQAPFTGFCPGAMVFRKMGLKDGCAL